MNFYPMLIAFLLVFISELGDKTQLLVISFATKQKVATILFGVALGSFLSHGVAILFGSSLGAIQNETIEQLLKLFTNLSFLLFGIMTLCSKKNEEKEQNKKTGLMKRIALSKLNYIFVIALSIAIGELGDKTFLASIGLGVGYPQAKLFLIIGAVLGMVVSDLLAVIFGKLLSKKIPESMMQKLSGILFCIFGIVGLIGG